MNGSGKEHRILNYIGGAWRESAADAHAEMTNPATGEVIGRTPLSPPAEVDEAAQAAQAAFDGWRRVPAVERVE